ncbi:helicase [Prochlorococcus sp. MIT 1300]|uniref:helicase n=1 Tax=Prochlorococcus sp. MIT 1300 TaxID=3096218 RepID=UPI002A749ABE|nr:helicase [Prochlorococcus sp. MIT 1300]
MLEARVHCQLKHLLDGETSSWPHDLTLGRLIARSLRRKDHTLIQIGPLSYDFWWLGLLLPLSLEDCGAVLVISDEQRRNLLGHQLLRLQRKGFILQVWEDKNPAPNDQIWLLNSTELINAYQNNFLNSKQIIIPEAHYLTQRLRDAMTISVSSDDWDQLLLSNYQIGPLILSLYERMSRRIFAQVGLYDRKIRVDLSEIHLLQKALSNSSFLPVPWEEVLKVDNDNWVSWVVVDRHSLSWDLNIQPLEPLQNLPGLLNENPSLLISETGRSGILFEELNAINFSPKVQVKLQKSDSLKAIPLYAPQVQPVPNSPVYPQHILEQSRRLILGQLGITIILLDDLALCRKLTSELAAVFGKRVVHETICIQENSVICCRCSWWLSHCEQLPFPKQIIVALLPLPSLESPITAARVDAFKRDGRDWFRSLLLPEALALLTPSIASLRVNQGRLAILDGRVRLRSWGKQVLSTLEPWIPLQRLLPH